MGAGAGCGSPTSDGAKEDAFADTTRSTSFDIFLAKPHPAAGRACAVVLRSNLRSICSRDQRFILRHHLVAVSFLLLDHRIRSTALRASVTCGFEVGVSPLSGRHALVAVEKMLFQSLTVTWNLDLETSACVCLTFRGESRGGI